MSDIKKGLAGVVVDESAISKVNAETNSLLYRGYPVDQLAAECSFEEVAYLLWHGELPDEQQLAEFAAEERAHRELPRAVVSAIESLPTSAHPMDVVRTGVSMLGALDEAASDDSAERDLERGVNLLAKIPTMIALDQRRRRGLAPVTPHEELDYVDNFLYMTFGEVPTEADAHAFTVASILYAEHSFNASTFTARVVTSTLADLYSAVTAAICALKGPLHGGANEAVMVAFDEIGDASRAEAWLDAALADKRKIMGFGHRVYKNGDSRVPTAHAALIEVAREHDGQALLELADALEAAMQQRKGIKPNLDYPCGPLYHLLGFDTEMFTPLFIAARITGWTAHIVEQRANNALIRPLAEYTGVEERALPGR